MKEFFSAHKKFFGLLSLLLILAAIPVTVFYQRQQQDIRQRAFTSAEALDNCGKIKVTVTEDPSCPQLATANNNQISEAHSGAKNNITAYTTVYAIQNVAHDDLHHRVKVRTRSYFCTEPFGKFAGTEGDSLFCGDNEKIGADTEIVLAPGEFKTIPITRHTDTGTSCGSIQEDLDIVSVDNDPSCTFSSHDPHDPHATSPLLIGWGMCQTGTACHSDVTPTPLHPSATPTPFHPTPSICPVPDIVKNVRIDCPFCSQ